MHVLAIELGSHQGVFDQTHREGFLLNAQLPLDEVLRKATRQPIIASRVREVTSHREEGLGVGVLGS